MPRPATGQVVTKQTSNGTVYALRFRAYGERRYLTLGTRDQGWTAAKAESELQNVLADVRRGTWRPPAPAPPPTAVAEELTFHEFASEWFEGLRYGLAPRTIEDYELALSHHLLPFFAEHKLSAITAREIDRYKAAKVREREGAVVERPLSNRTINKTLTRLGQISVARGRPTPRLARHGDHGRRTARL
jgi:integrase